MKEYTWVQSSYEDVNTAAALQSMQKNVPFLHCPEGVTETCQIRYSSKTPIWLSYEKYCRHVDFYLHVYSISVLIF
jgi:hypothetical protein